MPAIQKFTSCAFSVMRHTSILAVLYASGCHQPSQPVRVGYCVWIGSEPLNIVQHQRCLDERQMQLFPFMSGEDAQTAFRQGKIDVVHVTLDTTLRHNLRGMEHRPFLILSRSIGADVIRLRKTEASPGPLQNATAAPAGPAPPLSRAALKGKMFALEVGSVSHYFLARALQHWGLRDDDVKITNIAVSDSVYALAHLRVDAVVTWEPFASEPVLVERSVEIFSSASLRDDEAILDILAASPQTLERRAEDLQALAECWHKAVRLMDTDPGYTDPLLARVEGVDVGEFRRRLSKVHLIDLKENKTLMGIDTISPTLLDMAVSWNQFLADHKYLDLTKVDRSWVASIFAPKVVRQARLPEP